MRELLQETADSVVVGSGASVPALPANTQRKYAEIGNPTAEGMFLGIGKDAVIGEGPFIPPGAVYVIDNDNLWRGVINVIAAAGAGHVISTSDWQ